MALTVGALLLAMAPAAHATTMYLCTPIQSGGQFWTLDTCSQHRARIERIYSVPEDLSFESQVHLAERLAKDSPPLILPISHVIVAATTTNSPPPPTDRPTQCRLLDERIASLETLASQPLPSTSRAWIAEEQRKAAGRRASMQCGSANNLPVTSPGKTRS